MALRRTIQCCFRMLRGYSLSHLVVLLTLCCRSGIPLGRRNRTGPPTPYRVGSGATPRLAPVRMETL
ncbi:hypothetical protein ACFFX0_07975 [Citricoccus parietis]|uniref:Uncharacterized protein n=1 Tax=Citricoccus parietis TaxID=592307 RepID=A0ABV5FXH7_9MICC